MISTVLFLLAVICNYFAYQLGKYHGVLHSLNLIEELRTTLNELKKASRIPE